MISWAMYRKYEHGDKGYYDLIASDDIIDEHDIFPQ